MAYKFFPGTPFGAYSGKIASRAFSRANAAGEQINGNVIVASVDFSSPNYAVGGEPLGNANPNFAVLVDYQAGANIPQPFIVQSVYVDNSNSIVPIFIFFADTLYTAQVEAGAQGWFPVISNSPQAYVIAIGLQTGFLPLVNVYFSNLPLPPYTAIANPNVIPLKLASPTIGGGAPLSGIEILASGSWYTSGALEVAGGDGSATAQGVLNSYGQFTNVTNIDTTENFSGLPSVMATASQVAPSAYAGGFYDVGDFAVSSPDGLVWVCNVAGNYPADIQPQAYTSGQWSNTGQSPTITSANFLANLGNSGASIITDGYGPAALGDQPYSLIAELTETGIFANNVFGSPYAQGFIYICAEDVRILSEGVASWRLQSSDGTVIIRNFQSFASMANGTSLIDMSNENLKLDAIKTWQLNCTDFVSDVTISYNMSYTYALV